MSSTSSASSASPNVSVSDLNRMFSDPTFCDKFHDLMKEFLDALHESFPQCPLLISKMESLNLSTEEEKKELLVGWHRFFSEHKLYEKTDAHDDSVWSVPNLPVLGEVDLATKIQDVGFFEENKEVMWEYIVILNRYSRMYNVIPPSMVEKIFSFSTLYAEQIQNSAQSMNLEDFMSIGQQITSQLSGKDYDEMSENIQGLVKSFNVNGIEDIMNLFQNFPAVNSAMQQSNLGDIQSITQSLTQTLEGIANPETMQQLQSMLSESLPAITQFLPPTDDLKKN